MSTQLSITFSVEPVRGLLVYSHSNGYAAWSWNEWRKRSGSTVCAWNEGRGALVGAASFGVWQNEPRTMFLGGVWVARSHRRRHRWCDSRWRRAGRRASTS